jgi:hypothetical protein
MFEKVKASLKKHEDEVVYGCVVTLGTMACYFAWKTGRAEARLTRLGRTLEELEMLETVIEHLRAENEK